MNIQEIEDRLRDKFVAQVIEPGIKDPVKLLRQWSYLSSQVSRLHGAALSRIRIPDIQRLLAEIAYGECGSGDGDQIHSKLFYRVVDMSPSASNIRLGPDESFMSLFEETILELSHMNQDRAIGFIVGLEAPAYQILQLLKEALVDTGTPEEDVIHSEYFVIHEKVEIEHQQSGHEAMEIVMSNGFETGEIYEGGDKAINFLVGMVGNARNHPIEAMSYA